MTFKGLCLLYANPMNEAVLMYVYTYFMTFARLVAGYCEFWTTLFFVPLRMHPHLKLEPLTMQVVTFRFTLHRSAVA